MTLNCQKRIVRGAQLTLKCQSSRELYHSRIHRAGYRAEGRAGEVRIETAPQNFVEGVVKFTAQFEHEVLTDGEGTADGDVPEIEAGTEERSSRCIA